jgi:uncharacterized protein (DUF697 family)
LFGFLKEFHQDTKGQGFAGLIVGAVLSVVVGAIFIAVGQNIVNIMGLNNGNVITAFTITGIMLILIPLVGLVILGRSIAR